MLQITRVVQRVALPKVLTIVAAEQDAGAPACEPALKRAWQLLRRVYSRESVGSSSRNGLCRF